MTSDIRDCLPPDRNPHKPNFVLPRGSIDTHVHVFEPGYPLSPGRGYNPPDSTLADLEHLHATLGVDRVVFTQPSIYGIDNSAILDAAAALNAETPNRARCVVAISLDIADDELAALDAAGVRGVRLNTDNKGGMPIEIRQIPDLVVRIAPFGWHIEFLFPGKDIVELMPTFSALKVPMSIGHFAYQPATAGVRAPGFQALLELMRRGNTWMKISGANRVSATDLPPYDDVKPMARALIEAAPERDHVGHRLAASQQVRGQSQRWRPGRRARRLGHRSGDAPQGSGRYARRLLPLLNERTGYLARRSPSRLTMHRYPFAERALDWRRTLTPSWARQRRTESGRSAPSAATRPGPGPAQSARPAPCFVRIWTGRKSR